MERFNVPIPYGEDFQTEYVDYKRMFFGLTELVDRLQEYGAKVTELARWMYQVMDESCAAHYPYEPAPVSMQALVRAKKELRALGIEAGELQG